MQEVRLLAKLSLKANRLARMFWDQPEDSNMRCVLRRELMLVAEAFVATYDIIVAHTSGHRTGARDGLLDILSAAEIKRMSCCRFVESAVEEVRSSHLEDYVI